MPLYSCTCVRVFLPASESVHMRLCCVCVSLYVHETMASVQELTREVICVHVRSVCVDACVSVL